MSSQQLEQSISQINFTGGFPTRTDLAPSIIFLVIYAATCPVLVWRWVKREHRTTLLFRPTLFILCRLGMLGLRCYMAVNGAPNVNVLVAELVLVSVGYIFLCDTLVGLWKRHVETVMPMETTAVWVQQLARILRLLLLASIITIIISSVQSSSSYSGDAPPSASDISTPLALRHASYCLSMAVPIVTLIALGLTHREFGLPAKQTCYILIPGLSLLIVGVYRVAQTFSTSPSDPVRQKAVFWCLQILFDFVAYVSFLAISIPTWYPLPKYDDNSNADTELARIGVENKAYPGAASNNMAQNGYAARVPATGSRNGVVWGRSRRPGLLGMVVSAIEDRVERR